MKDHNNLPPSHDFALNYDLTKDVLAKFIRDEFAKVGKRRAVIGISGGVDSALAAFLVVNALGNENVLGVRLPYSTSSAQTLEHANLVIDALDIRALTIDISPMVDPLFGLFPGMSVMRKGNILARERMIVLYDQSEEFDALVLGTSNKTEILLGYSTIFGDSAAAIHPMGDLYKTQVWQFARHLGVPEVIVSKPPSADFWPGQTDEGELGFTYEEADQVLYLLVEGRCTRDEVITRGFSSRLVNRIYERMRMMQFKRVLPVIPKISTRTVGIDFLYLRNWGAKRAEG